MNPLRTFFLLLLCALPAVADDLPQLRDGESRDHRYDTRLLNQNGQLRFRVVSKPEGKTLGEIASVYEPLVATNPTAPDLARKTRAYWSPDARYLVLREPDNSETQSGVILVSVRPDKAERIPLSLEKLKTLSPKEHTDWSVEFGQWLGKRAFLVQLYGMTYHQQGPNEHDRIPIVVRIRKDGGVSLLNADE